MPMPNTAAPRPRNDPGFVCASGNDIGDGFSSHVWRIRPRSENGPTRAQTPFATVLEVAAIPLSEADTHGKLVNPALYGRGWTEAHIKREETLPPVEIVGGRGRRHGKGRTDLTLRIIVNAGT